MAEDKTIRERISILEDHVIQIKDTLKEYKGMEAVCRSLTEEVAKTNRSIEHLTESVDSMNPIVKEIVLVKGYGSFTWKLLKWVGGVTLTIITTWHFVKDFVKDSISHFFHYIFNN